MKQLCALFLVIFAFNTWGNSVDSLKKCVQQANGEKKVNLIFQLVDELNNISPGERAQYVNYALDISKKIKYKKGEIYSYNYLAAVRLDLNKIEEAKAYLDKALTGFTMLNDSLGIAKVYSNYAYLMEKTYKYQEAVEYHKKAAGMFERLHAKRECAIELNGLGLIIGHNGSFNEALKYFFKVLEIRKELRLSQGIGMVLNNIGSMYWRLGNYEKALESFQNSLPYRKQNKDTSGVILLLNNIGLVYEKINYLDKALEYYTEAINLANRSNLVFGKAYTYHNIGVAYSKKKDYKTALQYTLKSLECYNSLDETGGIILSLNDIGSYYENMGDISVALQYYHKALDSSLKIADKYLQMHCEFHIGRALFKQKNYNESLKFLYESKTKAEKQGFNELIKDNCLCISQNYYAKKEYKNAYDFYAKYDAMRDTLYTQQLVNDLANYRIRYDTENKIKENDTLKSEISQKQAAIEKQKVLAEILIVVSVLVLIISVFLYRLNYLKKKNNKQITLQKEQLQKLNNLLDVQNKELNEINKNKDKLFSIVAHDLKNPFQALIGFSEILYNEIENLNPDKVKNYAKNINDSSKNLLSLTRNLLDWARIQSEQIVLQPEEINTKQFIEDIVNIYHFSAEQKNITLYSNTEDHITVYADKYMINTVMRNLISNAIKFTYEGGFIKINAEENGNDILFTVKDNGTGIPEAEIEKLFNISTNYSKGGTNREKGTGLGLILCKDFIELSKGKIWVESKEGEGSSFMFTLPKSKTE